MFRVPCHLLPLKWLFVYSRVRMFFIRRFRKKTVGWTGTMYGVLWMPDDKGKIHIFVGDEEVDSLEEENKDDKLL